MSPIRIFTFLAFSYLLGCDDPPESALPTPAESALPTPALPTPNPERVEESPEGAVTTPEPTVTEQLPTPLEPGDPVDDGRLQRAPRRVTAHVRRLRSGEEARDAGGDMIAPDRYAFGLPAISADNNRIAWVEHVGDEFNWQTHVKVAQVTGTGDVVVFNTESGSIEANDGDEEALEASWVPMRREAARLNQYLRDGGFRSLTRLPHAGEEPSFRDTPLLEWNGERTGEVVVRDPGNSRARYNALPLNAPSEPIDSDEEGNECRTDTPASLDAWFAPDPDTLFLVVVYEHAADWCSSEYYHQMLRLPEVRQPTP